MKRPPAAEPKRPPLLVRIACAWGLHQRSSSQRRWTGTHWISRCRFCDTAMRRSAEGRWRAS